MKHKPRALGRAKASEPSAEAAPGRADLKSASAIPRHEAAGQARISGARMKKHGAPLGNRNAFKHGFYSAAFKAEERRLLEQVPVTDLAAEIELVRVTSYRFIQALNAVARPLDIETQLAALRAVNLSAHSIASLLRVRAWTMSAAREADLEGTDAQPSSRPSAPQDSPRKPPSDPESGGA